MDRLPVGDGADRFRAAAGDRLGDGLNDIEMLQGAGVGVAMGNGHRRAKGGRRPRAGLAPDGIATMLEALARKADCAGRQADPTAHIAAISTISIHGSRHENQQAQFVAPSF